MAGERMIDLDAILDRYLDWYNSDVRDVMMCRKHNREWGCRDCPGESALRADWGNWDGPGDESLSHCIVRNDVPDLIAEVRRLRNEMETEAWRNS